jgi:phenylalanyl-tRNA synthetase beta chain
MLAPLSWIRDFTPADAPVDELVAALNQLGLEVDGVEEPGREVVGVRVARIVDVVPHPDADRLRLADVDLGEGSTRVVCGASNIAPGMVVPFAPVGAQLPGGLTLERRKIRGQVSEGMLLSPRELGLGDDHEGILELDPGLELGTDVRDHLGLDDVVFDLAITPNRPDAMCIIGVAREIAAFFGQPLTVPEPAVPRPSAGAAPDVTSDVTVTVDAPERCPRYLGWVARVVMGESPAWMQQRLLKAGMRAISNVVDVTNYVLLERNQPLHAFDLARLGGRGIVVRLAEAGERITTLDGVDRDLEPDDLLICDAERRPQAIAGVMGGATAEVAADTTEMLLESAFFERMGIARTSKRLRLRSEASARFERGTDPEGVAAAATRAMELLARSDIGGAQVAPDAIDEHPILHERPRIHLRTSYVNRVLGTELGAGDVLEALRPLEIDLEGSGDALEAVPPSFRPDLEREVDLVEEVARRIGFEAIGRTVPKPAEQVGALSRRQQERRKVADALVGAGATEAMPLPLVAPALLSRFGVTDAVELTNPLRAEESSLRTSLVPGLVAAGALNAARGQPDVTLFEIGAVFHPPVEGALLPMERERVAAVAAGTLRRSPIEPDRAVDAYDAVDLVGVVVDALGVDGVRVRAADGDGWRSGASADVLVGDQIVGRVGVLGSEVAESLGAVVVGFELDLDALGAAPRRDRSFVAPSPFPPSTIDLSFVTDDDEPAGEVVATIEGVAGELLEDVRVFDEFRADALGPGRRSITLTLRFRAPDRTLTDADVGELRARCVAAVTTDHRAALRT